MIGGLDYGYQATLSAAAADSALARPQSKIYELGCSPRGCFIGLMDRKLDPSLEVELVGVDCSEAMLKACKEDLIDSQLVQNRLSLIQEDIRHVELSEYWSDCAEFYFAVYTHSRPTRFTAQSSQGTSTR